MDSIPEARRRRSIRLKGYDYSRTGAYFVTTVTQNRLCLFGDVVGDEMHLNEAGIMAQEMWETLPHRFPGRDLDAFVIMPNHIHGIIAINEPVGASLVSAQDNSMATGERATTRVAPTGFPANMSVLSGLEADRLSQVAHHVPLFFRDGLDGEAVAAFEHAHVCQLGHTFQLVAGHYAGEPFQRF